jgi:hypothetical protein
LSFRGASRRGCGEQSVDRRKGGSVDVDRFGFVCEEVGNRDLVKIWYVMRAADSPSLIVSAMK